MGAVALTKKGVVDDHCNVGGIPEACDHQGKTAADELGPHALASTVGLSVGAALVVLSTVLFLTEPPPQRPAAFLPGAGDIRPTGRKVDRARTRSRRHASARGDIRPSAGEARPNAPPHARRLAKTRPRLIDPVAGSAVREIYGVVFRALTLRSPCGQLPRFLSANALGCKPAYTFTA